MAGRDEILVWLKPDKVNKLLNYMGKVSWKYG